MEKLVRIMDQRPMVKRDWTNSQGETITLKSVELVMTDGNDTFVAEATDQMAETLSDKPLDKGMMYGVRLKMSIRTWENKDHVMVMANNVKLMSIAQI
ncbi:MAG: hypothetical protein K6A78_10490 [Prevotella sp.]|nr:hypothetical protein [Prevotella sp.]